MHLYYMPYRTCNYEMTLSTLVKQIARTHKLLTFVNFLLRNDDAHMFSRAGTFLTNFFLLTLQLPLSSIFNGFKSAVGSVARDYSLSTSFSCVAFVLYLHVLCTVTLLTSPNSAFFSCHIDLHVLYFGFRMINQLVI